MDKNKLYKKIARKNWKRKNNIHAKALNDVKLWGEFNSTDEVFSNLIVPVPIINKELEHHIEENKFNSLIKKSHKKLIMLALKIYFAEEHYIYNGMFLGTILENQKQFSTNKVARILEFYLSKIKGYPTKDEEERIANAYNLLPFIKFTFMNYNKSIEYFNLIANKKYEDAREFLYKNQEYNYNATSIRMSLLLKRNYKVIDLDKKDFTQNINSCYLRKYEIEKPYLSGEDLTKVAKNMFKKDEISKEEFSEVIKNSKNLKLEDVLNGYKKTLENKIRKYEIALTKDLEDFQKDAIKGKINKLNSHIMQVEKVIKGIEDNCILSTEYQNQGREYNLFTQLHKELRTIVLSFMGFTYEIDLKFSNFQLLKDNEKKFFRSNVLENAYNKLDEISQDIASKIQIQNENKRKMFKKSRKTLKTYWISIMNGMPAEFVPYYFTNRLDNETIEFIKNYGKAIEDTYVKFKNFYVENKLKFYNKELKDKSVNEDNIVFVEYTKREERVMKELSSLLNLVSVRIHDALFVKSNDIKSIKNTLENFDYDISIDKINKKFLNYIS